MERLVAGFGLSMVGLFFLLGFCVNGQWLLGCIPGFILSGFGLFFDENTY